MFNGVYHDYTQRLVKLIIDHYGYSTFHGMKILDLGAGHGDIGASFYRLGAQLTAVDIRPEHLKMIAKKYPGMKTQLVDLDKDWPFSNFDLILNLDLICHLKNFENHLRNACNSTSNIVIETAICDSSDSNMAIIVPENRDAYDASFNGFSARPSGAFIERILKECGMDFKRFDYTKLGSGKKVYDWRVNNTNSCDDNKRRFWIAKRTKTATSTPTLPLVNNPTTITPGQPLITSSQPIYNSFPPSAMPLPQLPSPIANSSLIQPNLITTPAKIVYASKPKIRLFYNYYNEKVAERKNEIDFCLNKNIENNLFDLVILESETRPTFDFFFQKINQLVNENDISIFCNSDIFFDQTIDLAKRIGNREVFALSRHDWNWNGSMQPSNESKQDCWIVRGKVEGVSGDFLIGLPGSAQRIAYQFKEAGYKVINPSKSINVLHLHSSKIRNYTETDRISGEIFNIEPSSL